MGEGDTLGGTEVELQVASDTKDTNTDYLEKKTDEETGKKIIFFSYYTNLLFPNL